MTPELIKKHFIPLLLLVVFIVVVSVFAADTLGVKDFVLKHNSGKIRLFVQDSGNEIQEITTVKGALAAASAFISTNFPDYGGEWITDEFTNIFQSVKTSVSSMTKTQNNILGDDWAILRDTKGTWASIYFPVYKEYNLVFFDIYFDFNNDNNFDDSELLFNKISTFTELGVKSGFPFYITDDLGLFPDQINVKVVLFDIKNNLLEEKTGVATVEYFEKKSFTFPFTFPDDLTADDFVFADEKAAGIPFPSPENFLAQVQKPPKPLPRSINIVRRGVPDINAGLDIHILPATIANSLIWLGKEHKFMVPPPDIIIRDLIKSADLNPDKAISEQKSDMEWVLWYLSHSPTRTLFRVKEEYTKDMPLKTKMFGNNHYFNNETDYVWDRKIKQVDNLFNVIVSEMEEGEDVEFIAKGVGNVIVATVVGVNTIKGPNISSDGSITVHKPSTSEDKAETYFVAKENTDILMCYKITYNKDTGKFETNKDEKVVCGELFGMFSESAMLCPPDGGAGGGKTGKGGTTGGDGRTGPITGGDVGVVCKDTPRTSGTIYEVYDKNGNLDVY